MEIVRFFALRPCGDELYGNNNNNNRLYWMLSRPGPQSSTSRALTWIQCKLGKQYLEKKFTLPWESNPGPTPNRGDLATLVASVGLKKFTCGHSPLYPSKVGFPWLSTIR